MNKQIANILFGVCLIASVFLTEKALCFAGDLAYASKQPLLWVNAVVFVGAVILVTLGIFIKTKYGK